MSTDQVKRRLAAIMSADVAGYSRLMGADEAGTLARLKALRRELVDPKLVEHHGRVVKTSGDGILIEFKSVVDAVKCAAEVQQAMTVHGAGDPPERRIRFRIGINLGDVIIDGRDIFGDGVNVAARLQAMADPGGVWISSSVFEGIVGKLDVEFEDLGEQTFKNIARPVHVYRVVARAPKAAGGAPLHAANPAHEKPAIAVLPFNNMSGDPEQEYFADGVVEDVTTQLARLPGFFVIARNSAFTYKGRAVDVRKVATELGVRYLLEGSVQKSGGRIRVNAQLIEAATGRHIWAEKYDREIKDLFAIQDEITQGIFAALQPHLLVAEAELAQRRSPENLDAWGFTVRARVKWYDIKRDSVREVEDLCRRAIAIEPNYGPAHAMLAAALGFGAYTMVSEDYLAMGREAVKAAEHAVEVDGDNPDVLLAAGSAYYFLGIFHRSHDMLARAVELNPNAAMACGMLGLLQAIVGQPDDGATLVERAMRLSPRDPQSYLFCNWLAFCHFIGNRFDEAVAWAERSTRAKPRYLEAWVYLAAALAEAGRSEDAKRAIEKARQLSPPLTLMIYKRPRTQGNQWQKLVDALQKAGLPA